MEHRIGFSTTCKTSLYSAAVPFLEWSPHKGETGEGCLHNGASGLSGATIQVNYNKETQPHMDGNKARTGAGRSANIATAANAGQTRSQRIY